MKALDNEVLACKFDVQDPSPLFAIWILALMLILHTQYTSRQTKIHIATKNPDDSVFIWCSFQNKEYHYDVPLMMLSGGCYPGFLQQFIHPSCDYIQMLKALIYSWFSWSLLGEARTSVVWCVTNGPHLCTKGSLMVLGRAFFIFAIYQSSISICVKSSLAFIETARLRLL